MIATKLFITSAAALLFSLGQLTTAQVAINTDGSAPDASAMLEIKSSNKGFLAPRLTLAQRTAIATPALGLMVYQTDGTAGLYYYNGTSWITFGQWGISGSNIYFNSGSVGIGNSSPVSTLSVGTSSQFQVNASGNLVSVNNVPYSFPSAQGVANSFLGNNGSGTLTWQTIAQQWGISGSNIYYNSGNVGVGNNNPVSPFSVGTASQFQVNASGNLVSVNNVPYSFPSAQGIASSFLTNNGSGTLTWTAITQVPSLTIGSVVFSGGGTTLLQDNANFFWDNTNKRLAIGANTFDGTYPEKFKVDAGATTSRNVISGYGTNNNRLRISIKNNQAGNTATSDFYAFSNAGTEATNFMAVGINSSAFSDGTFTIGTANDAHLYNLGQNLTIGTGTAAKVIKFHTGGTLAANERMRIDGTGLVGINTTTAASTLQVNGSFSLPVVTKAANYTATTTDYTIVVTAARTITLPNATTCTGRIYVIKKGSAGAYTVTIASAGGTIDGAATATFNTTYGARLVQSNGTNWYIISGF